MLNLLLVSFIIICKTFYASGSIDSSIQHSSTPKQAFSWDLNQSYKHDSIASNNSENGEEHTSVYKPEHLLIWGKKRKRNSKANFEQQQKQIETPTISPKKPRTSITKPRKIDKIREQDDLEKMVRGKGLQRVRIKSDNSCNPHSPSCKHWDDLDKVQQRREKRKMRYYAMDSDEKERSKKFQRIAYHSLSSEEKIARNRKQYAMRKNFLKRLKPEERSEWYSKKAEKERETKMKIRMGDHFPLPRNKLQTTKGKKRMSFFTGSETE